MPTIKLRNSQTANAKTFSPALQQGEVGINEADGVLYYRDYSTGNPVALVWSGGTFTGAVGHQDYVDIVGSTAYTGLNSYADDLVIGSGDATARGLTIYGTGYNTIAFADGTGTLPSLAGWVQYLHTDNSFRVGVNNATRLYIDSSGKVGLGVNAPEAKLHFLNDVVSTNSPSGIAQLANMALWYKDSTGNYAGVGVSNGSFNTATYGVNQRFWTNDTERFRLTAANGGATFFTNVGFNGETTPSAPIDFGTTGVSSSTATSADIANLIRLYDGGTSNGVYGLGISPSRLNMVAAGSIEFYAGSNADKVCRFGSGGHPQILGITNTVVSSVNYPGYAFEGDEDTGLGQIYGANTLSLVLGGVEKARFWSTGAMTLGTPSSSSAGPAGIFEMSLDRNFGGAQTNAVDINPTINAAGSGSAGLRFRPTYTSTSGGQYGIVSDPSIGMVSSVGTIYGITSDFSKYGTSSVQNWYAFIAEPGGGTTGTTNIGFYNKVAGSTSYAFYSATDAKVYTAGKVGIGTSSPGYKLEVVDGSTKNGFSGAVCYVEHTGADDSGYAIRRAGANQWSLANDYSAGDAFVIYQGGFSGTERLKITSSGSVGINTDPDYMLDVAGTGNFDSQLYVNGATYQYAAQPGASLNGSLYLSGNSTGVINNTTNGIYWHPSTSYAIYRKSGGWAAPDYQQLYVSFATGIVIDGGDKTYGLSQTDVRGTVSLGGNFRALYSSDTKAIARKGLTVYPYHNDDGQIAANLERSILNLTHCRANSVDSMPANQTGALLLRFNWPTGMRIRWRIRGSNFAGSDYCWSVDYQTYKANGWNGTDESCYAHGKVPFDRIRILSDSNSATTNLYYLCLGDTTTVWDADMITVDVDIGWSGASNAGVNRWSDLLWFAATSLTGYSTAFSQDAKVEPGRLYSRMVTGYNNDTANVDIGWHGDRNTGFNRSAADTISVVTGGTEKFRVWSNGQLSAGSYYRTNVATCFEQTLPTGATQIGLLNSPTAVSGNTTVYGIYNRVLPGTATLTTIYYDYLTNTATTSVTTTQGYTVSNAAAVGSQTNKGAQFEIQKVTGKSNWNIYVSGNAPSYFAGQVIGDVGSASAPTFAFDGASGNGLFRGTTNCVSIATNATERLRVLSSGNVVIGSSSPAAVGTSYTTTGGNLLVAAEKDTDWGTIHANDSSTATAGVGGMIVLSGCYNGSSGAARYAMLSGEKENSTQADYKGCFRIQVNGGAGVGVTERFRISSDGNVGIGSGNTSPSATLHVKGDTKFEGPITEGYVNGGNTGTAKTIALTNGTVQNYTLTGNCTFTMPTAVAGLSFTLLLRTGTGSNTATFTNVKWPGNTAPTITTTASRMDLLTFVSDGTNWYGSIVQDYTV